MSEERVEKLAERLNYYEDHDTAMRAAAALIASEAGLRHLEFSEEALLGAQGGFLILRLPLEALQDAAVALAQLRELPGLKVED